MAVTSVNSIMTRNVFTVTLDDTLHRVDEIMRTENFTHVPVVEEGKLVGIITAQKLKELTLLNVYDFHDNTYGREGYNRISDFQHIIDRNYHQVYPEDSIGKAVKTMVKYKVDCLPVVDWDGVITGILTSYDMLLFLNKKIEDGIIS